MLFYYTADEKVKDFFIDCRQFFYYFRYLHAREKADGKVFTINDKIFVNRYCAEKARYVNINI